MNRVCLIGRLGNDIEVRATQGGRKYAYFSLAVRRTQDLTDWIRCVAWEKTAETLAAYTKKGSQIGVEGSIQTYKYTDQYNKTNESMQVLADRIQLLDKKEETRSTQVDVPKPVEIEDEELPF